MEEGGSAGTKFGRPACWASCLACGVGGKGCGGVGGVAFWWGGEEDGGEQTDEMGRPSNKTFERRLRGLSSCPVFLDPPQQTYHPLTHPPREQVPIAMQPMGRGGGVPGACTSRCVVVVVDGSNGLARRPGARGPLLLFFQPPTHAPTHLRTHTRTDNSQTLLLFFQPPTHAPTRPRTHTRTGNHPQTKKQ